MAGLAGVSSGEVLPSETKPLGLINGPNAMVLNDRDLYRGVGVNYLDCFLRTLKEATNTSYDA